MKFRLDLFITTYGAIVFKALGANTPFSVMIPVTNLAGVTSNAGLAAFDNMVSGHKIPFYAAVPSPTIDWTMNDGLKEIIIEERNSAEVATIQGLAADDSIQSVRVIPIESSAANPAFDVTPARLVTGIITEKGVFAPHALKTIAP